MNQNDCSGKTLKPWPIFVDHYIKSATKHNNTVGNFRIDALPSIHLRGKTYAVLMTTYE